MKNEFASLLQKEMDRKDFLKHVGIGFAVITGAATLIKTLNNFGGSNSLSGNTSSTTTGAGMFGYGADAYGGAEPVSAAVARGTYS